MKKRLALLAISSLILTGCTNSLTQSVTETTPEKPVIVTSFFPITHLVEKIVGDQATVVQILPIGAE